MSYGKYVLPNWAQTLGWLMAVVSVAVIPLFMFYEVFKSYRDPEYADLKLGQVSYILWNVLLDKNMVDLWLLINIKYKLAKCSMSLVISVDK